MCHIESIQSEMCRLYLGCDMLVTHKVLPQSLSDRSYDPRGEMLGEQVWALEGHVPGQLPLREAEGRQGQVPARLWAPTHVHRLIEPRRHDIARKRKYIYTGGSE